MEVQDFFKKWTLWNTIWLDGATDPDKIEFDGAADPDKVEQIDEIGYYGDDIALRLCLHLPKKRNFKLYFDNYFSYPEPCWDWRWMDFGQLAP